MEILGNVEGKTKKEILPGVYKSFLKVFCKGDDWGQYSNNENLVLVLCSLFPKYKKSTCKMFTLLTERKDRSARKTLFTNFKFSL